MEHYYSIEYFDEINNSWLPVLDQELKHTSFVSRVEAIEFAKRLHDEELTDISKTPVRTRVLGVKIETTVEHLEEFGSDPSEHNSVELSSEQP
jgi:hypothetical protein